MGFDVIGGGSDGALPAGAATAAKQDTGNASLASILTELGQKTEPLDQQHAIVDSSALPTGASTAARQDTGNTSLATLAGTVAGTEVQVDVLTMPTTAVTGPLTDAQLRAAAVPVSGTVTASGPLTDAQLRASAVPVTANAGTNLNTSALALEATLGTRLAEATFTGRVNTQGQKTMAASTPIVIASDQSAVPISGTVTGNPATSFGKTITYVPVAQGAAGTTVLAAASAGNRHKIIGAVIVMDAAGTAKFTDGAADLTGAMAIATNGGFVLATSIVPYQQTSLNSALNLVTTVGAAKGIVQILTEA